MTDKMKKYRLFPAICLVAALLLSACSQDELAENNTALPEGEYPLQIGSVTLTAEVSEQPWTRVSENPADGMSSVWEGDEQIGVQIGCGQPGIYTVQADGSVESTNPVYWTSTATTYVNAWYPVEETVNLRDQSDRLENNRPSLLHGGERGGTKRMGRTFIQFKLRQVLP